MRLRHLLRYLKGTLHYVMVLYAKVQLPREVPVELKIGQVAELPGRAQVVV